MGYLAAAGYFVLAALIVLIPFALLWLLAWWFLRKRRAGKIVLVALSAILGALYLWAIIPHQPPKRFFKEEFNTVTGAPFPESGRFVFKHEKALGWRGDDYISCALIEISPRDRDQLRHRARNLDRRYPWEDYETNCLEMLHKRVPGLRFEAEISERRDGDWVYWGLIQDQPMVFIHHAHRPFR